MKFPAVKIIYKPEVKYRIGAEIPPEFWDKVVALVEKSIKARSGYISLELDLPKRQRSTGWHSQNHHIRGHAEDLAEQWSNGDIQYSASETYYAIKIAAMKAGEWPTKKNEAGRAIVNPLTKELEPMSEADATMEEDNRLINYIHWLADSRGWWLTEYVDGKPMRVYAGEPKEQQ